MNGNLFNPLEESFEDDDPLLYNSNSPESIQVGAIISGNELGETEGTTTNDSIFGTLFEQNEESNFDVSYNADDYEDTSGSDSDGYVPNNLTLRSKNKRTVAPELSHEADEAAVEVDVAQIGEIAVEDDVPVESPPVIPITAEEHAELISGVVCAVHEQFQSAQSTAQPNPRGQKRVRGRTARQKVKQCIQRGESYVSDTKKCKCKNRNMTPVGVCPCLVVGKRKLRPVNCGELRSNNRTKCSAKCHLNFTEEDRQLLLERYYILPDQKAKADFICNHVSIYVPQKVSQNPDPKRMKTQLFRYTLPSPNNCSGAPVLVCRNFFLNTLCLHKSTVSATMADKGPDGGYHGCDMRGRAAGKYPSTQIKQVKQCIQRGESYVSDTKKCKCKNRNMTPVGVCPCLVVGKRKLRPVNCGELRSNNRTKCSAKCHLNFTEEDRQLLLERYYILPDQKAKADFICNHVSIYVPQKVSQNPDPKRMKTQLFRYTLPSPNNCSGAPVLVCRNFFLNTLCLHKSTVSATMADKGPDGGYHGCDMRGRAAAEKQKKESQAKRQEIIDFICKFPILQPHYCRTSGCNRDGYLEWGLSLRRMHRLYVDDFNEFHSNDPEPRIKAGCWPVFLSVFKSEFNLGFVVPKKDKCTFCSKFRMKSLQQQDEMSATYLEHNEGKESARMRKQEAKTRQLTDESFESFCFDLEAVLQTPYSRDCSLFYKRKLNVYNLTTYSLGPNRHVKCYLWDETEGNRGSNEIATCVLQYLAQLPETIKEVEMFSDACGGQNRNKNFMAAMRFASATLNFDSITHYFMESGHSEMEVDTAHSCIEKARKKEKIVIMDEWRYVIRRARPDNPFVIVDMDHASFFLFDDLSEGANVKKDINGQSVVMNSIRMLQYRKSEPGVMYYNYNYDQDSLIAIKTILDARSTRSRERGLDTVVDLKKAYCARTPISIKKKQDLLALCEDGVIGAYAHEWYRAMPTAESAPDLLQAPNSALELAEDDLEHDYEF